MKKLIVALACSVSCMLVAAGCGGSDSSKPDNVAACQSFVEKVKCGSVDISQQVNCQAYANTTCDISDYFTCLEDHYVCDNGQYDSSKLATAGDCASKATCP
jgi:hypothetical protein